MTKNVLVIAESDSSGASGIQADIKTIMALSGYAMTAISVVTTQSHKGILSKVDISPSFIADQMRSALGNSKADCIKVGFLPDETMVNAVADVLDEYKGIPVIVDPSIVSRNGQVLVNDAAIAAWKRRLYINTKILTPNLKEAELLGGIKINDIDDMRHTATMMRTLGVENVVLKGGQIENETELYFIATEEEERIYERPRVKTTHTLGAGSTFSSALAISLAQNMDIFLAIEHSLDFLHQAMLHPSDCEHTEGAINQAFNIEKQTRSFHPEEIKIHKL
jgi:hydroxymethylpyrimidine/phosphomethylpyrimidine kinase